MKKLIKNNPITAFVLLTFIFSYLVGGIFNMWVNNSWQIENELLRLYLFRSMIVIGPAISAIIITVICKGKGGLKQLFKSLKPKVKFWFYYLLLPVTGFIITVASFYFAGLPIEQLFDAIEENKLVFAGHFFFQFILIGIGEELGWRGWLLPNLLKKHSLNKSLVLIILIWGLWHFPILFNSLEIVIPWIILLVSVTIIFTWIWFKVKGNILLLALTHASVNATQFFYQNQLQDLDDSLLVNAWKITAGIYLMIGIVIFLVFIKKSQVHFVAIKTHENHM
ncbi:CPBP family intramembrane glutamic endopeptidase [Mangrovivirga cuniculi]|uniref:CAAX prenyl protease 2/Lysostaphin resistance protein A-like domain-containing protein n=1 Tax=Mangrovivirga cuniculi TaxID=2715131 RepID=A0A4D7JX38_9BACT|nr:type II CAAX endopeptidase family protein [Mangrovivirga cuniculi]QCK16696.1 hypothetical protein DCC35_19135 [Mangrovivirga cuniculi]